MKKFWLFLLCLPILYLFARQKSHSPPVPGYNLIRVDVLTNKYFTNHIRIGVIDDIGTESISTMRKYFKRNNVDFWFEGQFFYNVFVYKEQIERAQELLQNVPVPYVGFNAVWKFTNNNNINKKFDSK